MQQPNIERIKRRITLIYIAFLLVAMSALIVASYLLYLYSETTPRALPSSTPTVQRSS